MKRKLLLQLEIDQLHITFQTQEEQEEQLDVQSTPEAGMSLPPSPLQRTAAAMRHKILDELAAINPQIWLPRLSREVPSDGMLEDAKRAHTTIATTTIIQTNEVVNAMAAIILEVLDYIVKKNNKYPPSPQKARLETKIKATQRLVRKRNYVRI